MRVGACGERGVLYVPVVSNVDLDTGFIFTAHVFVPLYFRSDFNCCCLDDNNAGISSRAICVLVHIKTKVKYNVFGRHARRGNITFATSSSFNNSKIVFCIFFANFFLLILFVIVSSHSAYAYTPSHSKHFILPTIF